MSLSHMFKPLLHAELHSLLGQDMTNATCMQFENTEKDMKILYSMNALADLAKWLLHAQKMFWYTMSTSFLQKRRFGEHRCPQCGRTWSSGNSWWGWAKNAWHAASWPTHSKATAEAKRSRRRTASQQRSLWNVQEPGMQLQEYIHTTGGQQCNLHHDVAIIICPH